MQLPTNDPDERLSPYSAQPGFDPGMLFFEYQSKGIGSHFRLVTYEILSKKAETEPKHRNDPVAG